MLFTLEALKAKHGDALLLHYGTAKSPKLIVIDGGPAGVYKESLRPRLEELKEERSPDAPLEVRMLMVSHLDDDHINGVLALTNELVEQQEAGDELLLDILTMWHNSFDDIVGNEAQEMAASISAVVKVASNNEIKIPSDLQIKPEGAAIIASVPQGRNLRLNRDRLAIPSNEKFENLVIAPATGKKTVSLGNGLKMTVIGPNEQRIEELQIEWNAVLKKKGLAKDKKGQSIAAAFVDESVFNLSSIVVVAEAGGKRMLLTGDGRGDDILKGLIGAGFLKGSKPFHVDLLKLPHHGSDNNVETDFFRKVTADHYVASGDGKHGNPEIATLQMISEARGNDVYTLHLTYKEDRVEKFFKKEAKDGKKYKVVYREDDALSLRVDLGEALG